MFFKEFKVYKTEPLLRKTDYIVGSILAGLVVFISFLYFRLELVAVIAPSVLFSFIIFSSIYFKRARLPSFNRLMPFYLTALGVGLINFNEEFLTNFRVLFPQLYGGLPYSNNAFVTSNIVSYIIFLTAPLLVYFKGFGVFLMPLLFYVVYGVLGGSISHLLFGIYARGYFPGLYTSFLYWPLIPILLLIFLRSLKETVIFIFLALIIFVYSMSVLII